MKTPSKYRAELLPLKPGTGYVEILIKDDGDRKVKGGGFQHTLKIRSDAEFVPSERELSKCNLTLTDWDSNKLIEFKNPILHGETTPVQELGLFPEETTEKQFDYLQAVSLVELINENYLRIY